jgi:UDP-N-acetylmuramoyl-L-alanyl-D-glutamate--2,6-diaminopimelate ligase
MKLKDFFPSQKIKKAIQQLPVKSISNDTRLVKAGDIFFIKKRENFNIFSALGNIENKVTTFVAELCAKKYLTDLNLEKPVIFVKDIQEAWHAAVDKLYGFNKKDFIFIGITGTKGKTTTAHLVYYLLKKLNKNASLISTIDYRINGKSYDTMNTTPDYLALRKIFSGIKGKSPKYVVMEISSHGIQQQRITGLDFSRCIFTNLKREHLDYHKSMQNYFRVKKSFFEKNKNATAVINIDDIYGRAIQKMLKNKLSYAVNLNADFKASNIILNKEGISFELLYNKNIFPVSSFLLGRHNVYNILAAVAAVFSLGLPLAKIIEYVKFFKGVEGRLEEISPGIFVDYAHTPDSLKKALLAVKDIGYKKIICVFGCGGNRDTGKRRIMGKVASNLADFTIITSDNPRNENPAFICSQITKGFAGKNYTVIIDREEAIAQALKLRNKDKDFCLLVAGKGHENCQIIGNKKIPFKDSAVIKEMLKTCS